MKRIVNFLYFIVIVISFIIGYLHFWPNELSTDSFSIHVNDKIKINDLVDQKYNAMLVWNDSVRYGEKGNLQFELCLDKDYQNNNQNEKDVTENKTQEYTKEHLIIESRIDMPGVSMDPGNEYLQAYNTNCNKFQWILYPVEPGTYKGKLWVYLVYQSENEAEYQRLPILVRDIEIDFSVPLNIPRKLAFIICLFGIVVLGGNIFKQIRRRLEF